MHLFNDLPLEIMLAILPFFDWHEEMDLFVSAPWLRPTSLKDPRAVLLQRFPKIDAGWRMFALDDDCGKDISYPHGRF